MKKTLVYLLLAYLIIVMLPTQSVRSAGVTPYDLISMVNDLRRNNGLPEMEAHPALMVAAQAQSDFLGSKYGTNFPDWESGHIGAGETYAVDRALAYGYSVSPGWDVVENWAGENTSTPLSDIVYDIWSDDAHMGNMLHPDVVHVGAGITEGEGYVYYIIDFALQYGSGGLPGGGVASTVPTTAVTPKVAPVTVATPNEDGSVYHQVEIGEALWSIATAYEVTVDQLLSLNNLTANAVIYEGQSLLVRAPYTPTPSPTATSTLQPPTRTPIPAQTARPVSTPAPEAEAGETGFFGLERRTMGMVLILICGIGLALIVVGTMAKEKKNPPPPSN